MRDINAGAIERRLADDGWGIVHPEGLSVHEQLDELSRASVVAGEEGSAFHTLMLLADVTDKRFHMFRRQGQEHRNIRTIGEARNVDQHLHSLDNEKIIRAEGRAVVKVSASSAEVLDALAIPLSGSLPATLGGGRARRVRAAARGVRAKRVLDVGGPDAAAAEAYPGELAVVVSQQLQVDPRSYDRRGIAAYEMDLATFVEHFRGKTTFDLVHLRASTATDRFRDFEQSLPATHAHTVWHLGDDLIARQTALAISQRIARIRIVRIGSARAGFALLALRAVPVAPEVGRPDSLTQRQMRREWSTYAHTTESHLSWWVSYALRAPGAVPPGAAWRGAVVATWDWALLFPGRAYRTLRRAGGRVLRRLGLRS